MKSVLGRGIFVFGESSCFLFAHELSCHMKLLFCMYAGIHRKQFCMALNSYKFYTTGIMTTAENCVILGYRKKISGGRELHRKEKDKLAIQTSVYTGGGEKIWVYYTRTVRVFGERLNEALKDFEQLPITIYTELDPEWEEYRDMYEMKQWAVDE